jgi:hypothetical protein
VIGLRKPWALEEGSHGSRREGAMAALQRYRGGVAADPQRLRGEDRRGRLCAGLSPSPPCPPVRRRRAVGVGDARPQTTREAL